jgi:hypothetical protein
MTSVAAPIAAVPAPEFVRRKPSFVINVAGPTEWPGVVYSVEKSSLNLVYFAVLDDAVFGSTTPVEPKRVSPVDPAARYTPSARRPRRFLLPHQLPD